MTIKVFPGLTEYKTKLSWRGGRQNWSDFVFTRPSPAEERSERPNWVGRRVTAAAAMEHRMTSLVSVYVGRSAQPNLGAGTLI